jgi:hypothetical protein
MPHYIYGIDLNECRTKAEILDWIFHISSGKTWADAETVKNLFNISQRLSFSSTSALRTPANGSTNTLSWAVVLNA